MGFDIECIIDIHTYPGEYFCPVCRTLVYPSEALQSQCTHLYCKPCLAHVANSTRACPYDGYLVTEADSKPLLESDKSLAENIGKVKVRCLYHRSGCTWEGQLSECPSHCSSCAFGNSPVICNRCGVQIIHRQVHDHAQNCPGVYQVQQTPDVAQDAAGDVSSGAAVAVNQNQPGGASGAQASQAQVSQGPSVPLVSGQDSSQQPNASSQAPAGVPAAVPTQEQWYQQQYQQYYQQYAGYAAYQQVYQQYNPYQQPAVQQHQPHVLAQPQQQSYAQAPIQVPGQSQPQAQVPPQPQPQPQPHAQAQVQAQPQLQQLNQPQSQPGQPVAIQTHPQILHQGQPQATTYIQPMTLQNQIQPQFHPQKQSHPAMPSHGAPTLQSALPHGFPTPSQQYNQSQPNVTQPQQQQQHVQALQYQQPQLTLQNSQPHSTIPQVQHQPQIQTQTQTQPHAQILPQPHLQNQTPSQSSHPASLNAPPHSLHSLHPVSGHQSYPQAQLSQHGQSGVLQQQPFHARPTSAPLPPGQMQGQILQQPALMVPTSSHGQMQSQHVPFASQVQVPGMPPAQQQQFHSQVSQMSLPVPQRPVVNPNQQPPPHQHVQQQPLPSISQPTPFTNQQGVQPQLRPQGPPYLMQQTSHGYFQSQQNAMVAPNSQHQQHTTYTGRPMMPTQGPPVHPPPFAPSSGGYGQASQIRPGHPGFQQLPMTQNFGNNMVSDQQIGQYGITSGQLQKSIEVASEKVPAIKDPGDPSKSAAEKVGSALITDSVGVKAPTSEAGISNLKESAGGNTDDIKQDEAFVKVGESEFQGGKDDAVEPGNERRLKEEAKSDPLESSPNGKSFEAPQKENIRDTLAEELEGQKNEKGVFLNAAGESLRATSGIDKGHHNKLDGLEENVHAVGSQTATNGKDSLSVGRHDQPFHSYGAFMNQQRPAGPGILQSRQPFGAPPGPPTQVRPEGLGLLPQPRSNLGEQFPTPLLKQPHDVSHGGFPGPGSMSSLWRGPGHLGTGHAPPLTNVNQRDGIMGRGPQYLSEGQFLLPNSGDPAGQRVNPFNKDQPKLSGPLERGPFGPPLGVESNTFMIHGGQGDDSSSVRSHDERLRRLHEPINSFSKEWPLDQGPKALDRVHAFNYDTDSRFGAASGGPPRNFPPFNGSGSFGLNDPRERDLAVGAQDSFRGRADPNGPGGGYLGHATHGFASGSPRGNRGRSGRDDFDGRDMRSIGYLGRAEFDGPEGPRFGEHVASGPTANHFRRLDFVGQDIPPGRLQRFDHLGRGNSPNRLRFGDGVGPFSGHVRGDPHGPGNIHHSIHFGDSFIGSKAGLRFGEPGFRSSFSGEGLRDGHYADDMDPFDRSRKRKPFSTGWCRICEVDCETVEGLDMHSQTREHQKMAMDLVKAIKQQNKKKQRLSNARAVREEANKTRKAGVEGRGGAKP